MEKTIQLTVIVRKVTRYDKLDEIEVQAETGPNGFTGKITITTPELLGVVQPNARLDILIS